jgi:uncharacterized membrane protein
MAYCNQCGAAMADGAAFCPKCGKGQSVSGGTATSSGLSENAAATLSYVLGWITGLIFFLIDRRPYVRFHAAQSMVVFGALHILRIILAEVFGFGWLMGGMGGWTGFSLGWGLFSLIGLLSFVLWIVCMIKAHQGERFKVPIAGDIAEGFAKS